MNMQQVMSTVSTNPGSDVDWDENPAKKQQNPACLQKIYMN